MTMLDRMRRHKGWLKWSLAIVILAFIILYIPSFLKTGRRRRQQRRRRIGRRPRDHRRPVPPRLPAADAGVPRAVRRQRRRADAEAARHRPAHRPADDRGGGGARRSRRGSGSRRPTRKSARASSTMPGVPGERPVHRRAALPADPADAEPADDGRTSSRSRSAAASRSRSCRRALTNWITVGDKEVEDEFKRRNEKVKLAVVSFPADKFREGLDATDAELERVLRRAQERAEDPREAQGAVRARRHAGDPQRDARSPPQDIQRVLRRQPAAVLDARAGARQPHPAEDRRQRRRGGEEAGGGPARAR